MKGKYYLRIDAVDGLDLLVAVLSGAPDVVDANCRIGVGDVQAGKETGLKIMSASSEDDTGLISRIARLRKLVYE